MYENELAFRDHPDPMWVQDRETLALLAVNDAAARSMAWSGPLSSG